MQHQWIMTLGNQCINFAQQSPMLSIHIQQGRAQHKKQQQHMYWQQVLGSQEPGASITAPNLAGAVPELCNAIGPNMALTVSVPRTA